MSAAVMETESQDDRRTVVVSGVPDVLPPGRMTDKLTIHFQSGRKSHGGDVEVVAYPTNVDGVAFVTFDRAEGIIITVTCVETIAERYKLLADAERVVRKEQQIMTDSEFPDDYMLTVFPFSRDVFLYVPSATVDLSMFGSDQAALIKSLQSAHRSLRFQPLLQQRKALIEGPFTAVQALREDLIRRASQLKSAVSAVKLREAPLNPRVISHHQSVGSVSCSGSKAEREAAGWSGLSTLLQSTGEASEVQSLLSKAKTQNASLRQKVSDETLVRGSFGHSDEEEGELRARSRLKMSSEYRGERTKARIVVGEETAGIISSLSGMDLLPAEETAAKQSGEDDVSQKHSRPDLTKTRGENHLGSRFSIAKDLKVNSKFPQTGLKDDSERDAMGGEELFAICPEDPKDIWIDSYTFRYIKKFHKKELDRYLEGVDMSAEYVEGSDLVRISLTEKQSSKAASRIQEASENLETLMEFCSSTLRVHEIIYDEAELPDKQKLTQICEDVNFLFDDVLYVFEGSCIKVVGPSVSSHLFYRRVEDRMSKLRGSL